MVLVCYLEDQFFAEDIFSLEYLIFFSCPSLLILCFAFLICLEATAEVLPRLFKIKYESGTLEELLYVDMPRESQNSSGQIVLEYAKATQESVFEQLRVVRDGQLRIVFSPDLKVIQITLFLSYQTIIFSSKPFYLFFFCQIFSWEFCARRHEELIPRRLLIPQVTSRIVLYVLVVETWVYLSDNMLLAAKTKFFV